MFISSFAPVFFYQPPSPGEEAAKRKKTDEPSPDVPPEDEPDVGDPKVKEEESFVAEEEQEVSHGLGLSSQGHHVILVCL